MLSILEKYVFFPIKLQETGYRNKNVSFLFFFSPFKCSYSSRLIIVVLSYAWFVFKNRFITSILSPRGSGIWVALRLIGDESHTPYRSRHKKQIFYVGVNLNLPWTCPRYLYVQSLLSSYFPSHFSYFHIRFFFRFFLLLIITCIFTMADQVTAILIKIRTFVVLFLPTLTAVDCHHFTSDFRVFKSLSNDLQKWFHSYNDYRNDLCFHMPQFSWVRSFYLLIFSFFFRLFIIILVNP